MNATNYRTPFILLGLAGMCCLTVTSNAQPPDNPKENPQVLWRDTLDSPDSVAWARDRVFGAVVSIVTVTESHQDGRADQTDHQRAAERSAGQSGL